MKIPIHVNYPVTTDSKSPMPVKETTKPTVTAPTKETSISRETTTASPVAHDTTQATPSSRYPSRLRKPPSHLKDYVCKYNVNGT